MNTASHPEELDDLEEVGYLDLDVNASDLDANRAGRMSPRQVEWLAGRMAPGRRFGNLMALFCVLTTAVVAGYAATAATGPDADPAAMAVPAVAIFGITGLVVLFSCRRGRRVHDRTLGQAVKRAEGEPELYDDGRIFVGNMQAWLMPGQRRAFERDGRYRVYYIGDQPPTISCSRPS